MREGGAAVGVKEEGREDPPDARGRDRAARSAKGTPLPFNFQPRFETNGTAVFPSEGTPPPFPLHPWDLILSCSQRAESRGVGRHVEFLPHGPPARRLSAQAGLPGICDHRGRGRAATEGERDCTHVKCLAEHNCPPQLTPHRRRRWSRAFIRSPASVDVVITSTALFSSDSR